MVISHLKDSQTQIGQVTFLIKSQHLGVVPLLVVTLSRGKAKSKLWWLAQVQRQSICGTASTACELIWLKALLLDLGIHCYKPITLHCDNQVAMHIASNPVFHERSTPSSIQGDSNYVCALL